MPSWTARHVVRIVVALALQATSVSQASERRYRIGMGVGIAGASLPVAGIATGLALTALPCDDPRHGCVFRSLLPVMAGIALGPPVTMRGARLASRALEEQGLFVRQQAWQCAVTGAIGAGGGLALGVVVPPAAPVSAALVGAGGTAVYVCSIAQLAADRRAHAGLGAMPLG